MAAKVLPENCAFGIHPHSGKSSLLRKLRDRLQGYAAWMSAVLEPDEYRIVVVVVVDRDMDDCHELKSRLEDICEEARLRSRKVSGSSDWQVVTRIAIEELEAWYFGDWQAVQSAYPGVSPHIPNQAPYRDTDAISGGTWETFERILQTYGYFRQGLAKVQAATEIGKNMDPQRNRSQSFSVFHDAISEALP